MIKFLIFLINLQNQLINYLVKNASIYKTKIEEFLSSKVKNINLSCALENYKVDISDYIVDNSMVVYKETVDKYKNYEVKRSY